MIELKSRAMAAKDVLSRKHSFYIGKGPDAKETLDSFNRLKDSLKFRTNQLFIEWVFQTIKSSQNEETRKIVTARNSSKETVSKPTNLARQVSTEVVIVKDKSAESIISSPPPALAGLFTPPSSSNSCFLSPASNVSSASGSEVSCDRKRKIDDKPSDKIVIVNKKIQPVIKHEDEAVNLFAGNTDVRIKSRK